MKYHCVPLLLVSIAWSCGLAAQPSQNKRWLEDANGCKFLDPEPGMPAAPIRFSGTCVDGYVDGEGIVTLLWQQPIDYRGTFEKGILRKGTVVRGDGVGWSGDFKDNTLHGSGTIRFPNGRTIAGTFAEGLPVGAMDVTLEDGSSYRGEIDKRNYWPQGKGRLQWPDGEVYEGEFSKGQRHGKGKVNYVNGDVYTGEFAHAHLSGQGVYEGADGYRYEGQWLNDGAHGRGTQKLVDGTVYVGEFINGHRQGRGRSESLDGTFQEGEWKNDLLHGKCEFTQFVEGGKGTYSGECLAGMRHGKGRWEDPRWIYEGDFVSGNYHGHGRVSAPGYTYEGAFTHGAKTGNGKEKREGTDGSDTQEYQGDFERGQRHGRGVLRLRSPDGSELAYDGAFNQGVMEGQGVMTAEGFTLTGEFKADVLYRGTIVNKEGRKLELDGERGTVFEVLPDGTKKPVSESEVPDLSI